MAKYKINFCSKTTIMLVNANIIKVKYIINERVKFDSNNIKLKLKT